VVEEQEAVVEQRMQKDKDCLSSSCSLEYLGTWSSQQIGVDLQRQVATFLRHHDVLVQVANSAAKLAAVHSSSWRTQFDV